MYRTGGLGRAQEGPGRAQGGPKEGAGRAPTGMTSLAEKGLKKPETDWDDKPGKPRLVIPILFGVFWPKRAKKPETEWDDKPGKPRLVIPVCFAVFWPKTT